MQLLKHFKELSIYPKNAKELKGLILQLAVQGKLTADWRLRHPELVSGSHSSKTLLSSIKAEKEKLVKDKKIKKEKPLPTITADEIPYELPEGWEWCRIGNLGLINPRNTLDDNVEIGFIPMKNISKTFSEAPIFEKREWANVKKSFTHLKENDIAFAKITPCFENGKACVFRGLPNGYGAGTTELHVFRNVSNDLNQYFIYSILKSPHFLTNGEDKMTGSAGQKRVPKEYFANFVIGLPSKAEQKAIVETVNTLFKEVEALEKLTVERISLKEDFITSALRELSTGDTQKEWAYLQKHFPAFMNEESNIKKLRETILQLAVQGKLTANWRRSRTLSGVEGDSAKTLLASIKSEKEQLIKDKKIKKEKPLPTITEEEIPYELPEGWAWCYLVDVCTKVTDGFHNTPKKLDKGYKYISATHIKEGGILWKDCLYIGENEHSELFRKAFPGKGDILIVNRGAGCGTPALVDIDEPFSFQNAALIGFNQSRVDATYMNYFILQKRTEIMEHFVNGGAQPMLSNKILKTLLFPFPPFKEQKVIVDKINSLMILCDELEKQVVASKANAEMLMQSVLREVFQGKSEPKPYPITEEEIVTAN